MVFAITSRTLLCPVALYGVMTWVAIRTTSWRPFRRAPPGIGAIFEGCGNNRFSRALIGAL
jgi:hypothetical protein